MMNPADPISLSICGRKNEMTQNGHRPIETHLSSGRNLREHIENKMDDASM